MQEISLLEMLKSGVHFGHQLKRWHPKMEPYLYTTRGGIHVIDLEKTAQMLREACDFISALIAKGGKVLFVATKRQAQPIVRKASEEIGMPFVTERWIGGTLTNYENISKLTKRLKDLRQKRERGELQKYTKREQLQFSEEITYLESLVGGIEDLAGLPQAIFIVDTKKEKTALREARKKKIPVVAMVDSNSNPDLIDYPIPSNDDATKSIKLIVSAVEEVIKEAQQRKSDADANNAAEASKKKEEAGATATKSASEDKKE